MSYVSRVDYTADGVTNQFAIPFSYIKTGDVYLYQGGSLDAISVVTWLNPGLVQISPTPVAGTIEFRRQTVSTAMIAQLQLGELDPADLNLDYLQLLYLDQELADADTANLATVNASIATLAAEIAAIVSVNPAGLSPGTLLVYVSQYASLTAADLACAAIGGCLVLDKDVVLAGNQQITSAQVWPVGGSINLGADSVTFNYTSIVDPGPVQWLNVQAGGTILGNILNDVFYPEWTGAIGHTTVIASATVTRKAIQAWEAYDAQADTKCKWLRFTQINYAVDQPITNPNAGTAMRWLGRGKDNTSIYSTANSPIRQLTGVNAGSAMGVFQKGLTFLGNTYASGDTTQIDCRVIDWCGFEHEDMCYDKASTGFQLESFASFSENCRGRRNTYGPLLANRAINILDSGGSGSFRGFGETDFLWARTQGVSAISFMVIRTSGFLYNGYDFSGTVTNHTNEAVTLIVCQSGSGAYFKRGALDIEQNSTGSITAASTNPVYLGGGFHANCVNTFKAGTAYFDTAMVLTGSRNQMFEGWTFFARNDTGNGAPFVTPIQPQVGTSYRTIFKIDDGATFTAFVDATVFNDDIGTIPELVVNSVKVPYNTLGVTFDNTKIAVNTSGQVTYTLNLGAEVAVTSGTVRYSGGLL